MSAKRPKVVAFDVVETLFSLAPVDDALRPLGVPLPLFFAWLLRDGFALAAAGDHRPFRSVAASALDGLAPGSGDAEREAVLDAFSRLPPQPDAAPAVERLVSAGVPVVTLTNGGAGNTEHLLAAAGLDRYVERVISVDEAGRWKPAARPYVHATTRLGCRASEVALVAVHPWDVHGASRAGLVTGWCSRSASAFPEVFERPDVTGPDLVAVADGLLRLPM
ncbi:MAG: HAD-IA family hydrolase [Acidimicrobiia bacterium]